MDYSRDPDALERYYICRATKKLYTNFNISVELNRKTDAIQLSNALRAMILQTPNLTANAYRDDNSDDSKDKGANFKINYLEKIEFETAVSFEKFEKLDSEFFTRLDERTCPIGEQLPLWRLVVFENPDTQILSFYCEHTFFDGTSGVLFMKDLVRELDECWKSPNLIYQSVLFDCEKDAPSLGKISRGAFSNSSLYKISIFQVIRIAAYKLCVPSFVKKFIQSYVGGGPNLFRNPMFESGCRGKPNPRTCVRAVSLTRDSAEPLLKLCKANSVTFTPLLTTLTLYSFQQTVKKKLSLEQTSSRINIDINGRRYLPQYANKYGLCMSTSISSVAPIPSPDEWFDQNSPLRKTNKKLLKDIASRYPFRLLGIFNHINPWSFAEKQLRSNEWKTLDCSNVGVQDISCGDWYATSAWFSQSTGVASNLVLSCISVNGAINICFGFAAPLVDLVGEETIDAFEAHFKRTIREVTEAGAP
ncbi:hypothetical protein JA9_003946 [Meyerozyma sp. JA9]|nr:hypothetical protein JA9_003946 [Meyerozyma sp. JA9]